MSEVKKENIDRLVERKKKLEARIQLLNNRKAKEERKKDTRRKILAGVYMIKLLGNDLSRVAQKLEEAGILKEKDKNLFKNN